MTRHRTRALALAGIIGISAASSIVDGSSAFASGSHFLATVCFPDKKSALGEHHEASLKEQLQSLRARKEEKVTIAAWPDTAHTDQLSFTKRQEQRELAAQRTSTVKAFMQKILGPVKTQSINMAVPPNWFAATLKGEAAKAKYATLRDVEGTNHTAQELSDILRDHGGPCKVLVIAREQ